MIQLAVEKRDPSAHALYYRLLPERLYNMEEELSEENPFMTNDVAPSPNKALERQDTVEPPDAETLSCLTQKPLSPIFPFPTNACSSGQNNQRLSPRCVIVPLAGGCIPF